MDAEHLTLLEGKCEPLIESGISQVIEAEDHRGANNVAGDFMMPTRLLSVDGFLRRTADSCQVRIRPGEAAITTDFLVKTRKEENVVR